MTRRFGRRLKLFISYRRRFDAASARLLKDGLTQAFGHSTVFRDVDDITPGEDFPQSIRDAVESCDAFLTLISPGWVESAGRLQDPEDFVRREIIAALARQVPVIPVLIGGAQMPEAAGLPAQVRSLASRQAVELSDIRWDHDVQRLVEVIRALAARRTRESFKDRAAAALRFFFATRRGRLAAAALALAAAVASGFAIWYAPYRSFEACVGRHAPDALGRTAKVEAGAYDVPVVSADAYQRILESGGRADGVVLVVRLTDSGEDVGAVVLRYFKDSEVFKVEKVVEPRCAAVEQYANHDREGGDRRVLHNWDTLRARLGGRDYYLRVGDKGDRVLATLTLTPRKQATTFVSPLRFRPRRLTAAPPS